MTAQILSFIPVPPTTLHSLCCSLFTSLLFFYSFSSPFLIFFHCSPCIWARFDKLCFQGTLSNTELMTQTFPPLSVHHNISSLPSSIPPLSVSFHCFYLHPSLRGPVSITHSAVYTHTHTHTRVHTQTLRNSVHGPPLTDTKEHCERWPGG